MAKTVLVTGAGTGIGREAALEFAKAGYDVALHYNGSAQGAQEAAEAIRALGRQCMTVQANLTQLSQLRAMFAQVGERFGGLDAYVSNAGLTLKSRIEDMTAAMEMGRYGIRVNAIAPGWTDTGAARLGRREDSYYHIPLRRWCTAQEVAQAALFLCGQWAGSITGAALTMDGGASLQTDPLERYGYNERED